MKLRLLRAALAAAGLALLGFAVLVSGVVPIDASSGHWPVTEWLLSFAMRRSVATHSLGTEVPPLDDPALVLRGARHFELGCRPCHGAPDGPLPVIPSAMTPAPPRLGPRLGAWEDAELFRVVKHGIKLTGMPAWPAQGRDDEVWAVVAFLRRLPGLDGAGYRALVAGEGAAAARGLAALGPRDPLQEGEGASVPAAAAQACASCHGAEGLGWSGAFPRLAGQRSEYLLASLRAFAAGERASGIMQPIAAGLSEATMEQLARHYAGLPAGPVPPIESAAPTAPSPEGDEEAGGARAQARLRGAAIAREGVPAHGVPACVVCHGPGPHARRAAYPELAGQDERYLAQQLELFRAGERGGSPFARLMQEVAPRLAPEEIADVAAYYASLPPGATDGR